MIIIALKGPSSCGKSTTLNLVYSLVITAGGVSTCKKIEGNPIGGDFSDIVLYKGLKVAFFTMGDYSRILVEAIRNYKGLGIDILICACNIQFKNPLNEISKFPNSNIIPKTISSISITENAANTIDSNSIFGLI